MNASCEYKLTVQKMFLLLLFLQCLNLHACVLY